jgi:hypothetical protein
MGPEIFAIAAIASAGMSAMSSMQQGKAMQQKANAEARVMEWQGRVAAVNDRMAGVRALGRANEIMAAQAARGGAAGMLPMQVGGLPAALQFNTMRYGLEDMASANTNAMIALGMGAQQAAMARTSGKLARRFKTMEAVTTLASTAGSLQDMGAFDKGFWGG